MQKTDMQPIEIMPRKLKQTIVNMLRRPTAHPYKNCFSQMDNFTQNILVQLNKRQHVVPVSELYVNYPFTISLDILQFPNPTDEQYILIMCSTFKNLFSLHTDHCPVVSFRDDNARFGQNIAYIYDDNRWTTEYEIETITQIYGEYAQDHNAPKTSSQRKPMVSLLKKMESNFIRLFENLAERYPEKSAEIYRVKEKYAELIDVPFNRLEIINHIIKCHHLLNF